MSKRHPSRTTVWEMPPISPVASTTVLATPCFANWYAAVRPAGPAPMITGPAASELSGAIRGRV